MGCPSLLELLLELDNILIGLVAELYRLHHNILRSLSGAGFHHYYCLLGAGDDQVELAVFQLGQGWIQYQFVINIADMDGAYRAVKGYSEIDSAAEPPITARISGSFSWSAERTVMIS